MYYHILLGHHNKYHMEITLARTENVTSGLGFGLLMFIQLTTKLTGGAWGLK